MRTDSQLTTLINARLGSITHQQRIKCFVASFENIKGLFIQLKQAQSMLVQHAVHLREPTIFGKAIRIVDVLETQCGLSSILSEYRLAKVVVTLAPSSERATDLNTAILPTNFIKEVLSQLAFLDRTGTVSREDAIQLIIRENRKR